MTKLLQRLKQFLQAGQGWTDRNQPPPTGEANTDDPRAAQRAYGAIFTPRHVAEERTSYHSVGADGKVTQLHEEWSRDQGTLRSTTQRGLVVTASGSVAAPEQIKVQCGVCHDFDDTSHSFCELCGMGLCRRHLMQFPSPDGVRRLCPACFEQVRFHFNTWEARDAQSKGGSK